MIKRLAHLTPDQKAACSNHVGVNYDFFLALLLIQFLKKYVYLFIYDN